MAGWKGTIPLVSILALAAWSGCARQTLRPTRQPDRAVWIEPTWGPQTEGLQCRLRPTKRLWHPQETPAFRVDIRNQGRRTFAFAFSDHVPLDAVSVDGRWYHCARLPAREARLRPLGPDVEFLNLPLHLPEGPHLPLAPGRHIIHVALAFEGLEVVSNPVGIEILAPGR